MLGMMQKARRDSSRTEENSGCANCTRRSALGMTRFTATSDLVGGLAALFEFDGGFQGLGVALHGDFDDLADFAAAQGVREVVQILDGGAAELNEDVAGFEAGFGSRRAGLHVAEAHAIFGLAEIRNGAEPGAVAAAP